MSPSAPPSPSDSPAASRSPALPAPASPSVPLNRWSPSRPYCSPPPRMLIRCPLSWSPGSCNWPLSLRLGWPRSSATRLPVAEERGQPNRSDSGQLHDPGDHDSGQRINIRGGGEQYGRDGDQRFSGTDGEAGAGSAGDLDAAGESDGDGGADGDIHSGGKRNSAARLPVAEERGEHRGSDGGELHDPGNHDSGQWIGVRGGGEQYGRDGDEQCSDTDGQSGA